MSLKKKHQNIINLAGKYLRETHKNYSQVTLVEKLELIGNKVAESTLSKALSNNHHIGPIALETIAEGLETIMQYELCLKYNTETETFEKIPNCTEEEVNEELFPKENKGQESIVDIKAYPDGRRSITKKAQFMSAAQEEVIELGLRLRNFTYYFTDRNTKQYKSHIVKLLNKGVNLKCYTADFEEANTKIYFEDRAKFDKRELKKFNRMSEVVEELEEVIKELREQKLEGNMTLHTYTCLPHMHCLIIDGDSPEGKMLVSHYMYGIKRSEIPVIEISKKENPDLFSKYWQSAQQIISTSSQKF